MHFNLSLFRMKWHLNWKHVVCYFFFCWCFLGIFIHLIISDGICIQSNDEVQPFKDVVLRVSCIMHFPMYRFYVYHFNTVQHCRACNQSFVDVWLSDKGKFLCPIEKMSFGKAFTLQKGKYVNRTNVNTITFFKSFLWFFFFFIFSEASNPITAYISRFN